MPTEKIREDEEDIPQRRSSSRLLAKAEKNVADKTEEVAPSTPIRQRSRSRSTGRNNKPQAKIENDKLIITEEKETTGRRSRTATPTRTTRGKSPSREPTTPVRLTRSARKLGYRTPDAEKKDSLKLTFAESPIPDCTLEKESEAPSQSTDNDASIPEVIQISDEEDEPMDVSAAEFIEISPISKDVEDIRDNQEETIVTERIELQVERTLEAKYSFEKGETIVTNEPKDDDCGQTESNEVEHIQQVEEETPETTDRTEKTSLETISGYLSEESEKSPDNDYTLGDLPTHSSEETIGQMEDEEMKSTDEITLSSRPDDKIEVQITTTETASVGDDSIETSTTYEETALLQTVSEEMLCKKKKKKKAEKNLSPNRRLPSDTEVGEAEKSEKKKKRQCITKEIESRPEIESKKKQSESVEETISVIDETKEVTDETMASDAPSTENHPPKIKKGKKKTKVPSEPIDDFTRDYKKKQTMKPSRAIKEKNDTKKKMVENNEDIETDVCEIKYPDITLKKMFAEPNTCCTQLTTLLQELYAWNNKNQRRTDDLPDTFLNSDSETIWQFIAHKNRQIDKDWRKHKSILDEPLAVSGFSSEVEEDEEDEDVEETYALDENSDKENDSELDDIADEEECDLFNLKDEDLKDLERELEDERSLQSGLHIAKDNEKSEKKYRKSIVDDKFFNLAEMNAFCDEVEKQNEQENILLTADDSWGGPANYRYEDFFGTLDDVVGDQDTSVQATRKRKTDEANNTEVKKKSVRFALEDEDDEAIEEIEDRQNLPKTAKTLFGETSTEEVESRLKTDIRKLKESIRKFEEENLQPRSWELSGEVTAQQRAENELLETHVQFDNTAKRAPEITEEFTERIEALIKQRIKDQAFDDVVRIKKIDEKREVYRNDAIEEQETMKKSLTEVYEKAYQEAAGQSETSDKKNPLHQELEDRMNNLFKLVDAMSHFEYTPPTVRPEIKVVSNMAALQMEEVGMQASTDAQLLAPEEIRKKQRGELKGDEERTKTDKLRLRRKKKTKQRVMIDRIGVEKALAGQIEKKMKKKKVVDKKEDVLKSSNFFSKLQDTVQKELKDKTTKKKKVKSEKVKTSGSKFKL